MLYQEINCLNDENYENLVDKVEEEDDVNYTNADGMNLLHFAAKYNQLNVIEAMVGAKRLPNNFGYAPIHCAVEEGSLKVLRYFLKICSKKEILATEAEQRNLLHIAVESYQFEALRILLDDGRFNSRLEGKDIYGRTPYDVAVQIGNDKAIRLLSPSAPKDLTTLPSYDTAVDLSQNNIEYVLSDYLHKKDVDVKEILYTLGNCNGWEFLYQIYLTMGKEEEYFLMLKAIALWDRNLSSLKNRPPPGLEHYTDIKDIFEQVISNLVIAHSSTQASRELNTGLQQTTRKKQYDLLKDPKHGRQFRNLFTYPLESYNRDQLVEVFQLFSQWPNISIDAYTITHSISVYVTHQGKFKVYDPLYRFRVAEFSSAEEVVDHLMKFTFQIDNAIWEEKVELSFAAYKFYGKDEIIPKIEKPKNILPIKQSPNNYNELHYAIMRNDVDRVKQVLEDNPSLLYAPDAHNVYPIRMAIRFQNIECLNCLIEKYNSKIPIARQCDFVELCLAGSKIVKYFFKRQWISMASEDHLGNDLLKCAVISGDDEVLKLILNNSPDVNKLDEQGYLAISYALGVMPHDVYPSVGSNEEDIVEPHFFFNPKIVRRLLDHKDFNINQGDRWDFTPLMTSLEFKLDKEIINWILEKPNVNVNIQRYTGETALMIAINRNSSEEIIETLLRAGADLNLRNKEGYSAYDLAKDNPYYATAPDFIKKLKPLPLKAGSFAPRKKMPH